MNQTKEELKLKLEGIGHRRKT